MRNALLTCVSAFVLALPIAAQADDDFYGKIESQPGSGKVGQWVIGGRTVDVTAKTELEEGKGPHAVGTCVEVEFDDGVVEEIETERMRKCDKKR